jgi:hypothetical protein
MRISRCEITGQSPSGQQPRSRALPAPGRDQHPRVPTPTKRIRRAGPTLAAVGLAARTSSATATASARSATLVRGGGTGRPARERMMTKSRRKFEAAFKVKVALEASRESATVAEPAALPWHLPQSVFRLEAAAGSRTRRRPAPRTPHSKAARGMNLAPRPISQLTMEWGFI